MKRRNALAAAAAFALAAAGCEAESGALLESVGNGSIVSLHCGHADTVTAMSGLLDGLRSKGLRPVTMTELMSP